MTEKPDPREGAIAPDLEQRELRVANRETWVRAREITTGEHDAIIAEREEKIDEREMLVRLREEALQARLALAQANTERDRLLEHLRAANERLVIATLRADENAETESKGRVAAEFHSATLESQGRAKNEFLAMLGHELRNPLSPIVGALDLMVMRDPEAMVHEREIIRNQVGLLMRLVDDLLDLSRVAEGKLALRRQAVALDSIVATALDTVRPLLIEKHHHVEVDVPAQLVVDGDPIRLSQVFSNLVTNSAKYTPKNGHIEIRGRRRGPHIIVSVRDNGVGIAREMLPHVFEPYAQESRSRDSSKGGLGLGLAIVHRLVTMHGATVTVTSEGRDRGTEFTVSIPAATS
jgi:signal transduction histidine kinase